MNPIMEPILDTDSYKPSQWLQYPPGMRGMFSYFESRGGAFLETVFFGLQYILKKQYSQRITVDMVNESNSFLRSHGVPFNLEGWMYIAKDLEGRLPIRIRAVREGTVVPVKNMLMNCESTDEKVPWVPGWFETNLSRVWYPTTVATLSRECRKIIQHYLVKTCPSWKEQINFKLHDFGARGVSSRESAMLGGAAHLLNFMGSDTLAGVWMLKAYYKAGMAGFSIAATEHSTITSWGREFEYEAFKHFLEVFKGQLKACVSDSFNVVKAIEIGWGGLKQQIIDDPSGLVIRPDSGKPTEIVPMCLELCEKVFGATPNALGYKVINHNVRLIQGDGVDITEIEAILKIITDKGYSAENLAFGMGGGLLQKVNRDTLKFAYKCSAININGVWRDVYKDPATDPGKKSKAGRLQLVATSEGYVTERLDHNPCGLDVLETVFENGEILCDDSLANIRERCELR